MMTKVHLTPTEAGLLGALVGALATTVATVLAQQAARRNDHLTRVWEREMDIYERRGTHQLARD